MVAEDPRISQEHEMIPTVEEIETAERRRALEMPFAGMDIGQLRDCIVNDQSMHVRRLAVNYFEIEVRLQALRALEVAA
jgi:hypothetical protein